MKLSRRTLVALSAVVTAFPGLVERRGDDLEAVEGFATATVAFLVTMAGTDENRIRHSEAKSIAIGL